MRVLCLSIWPPETAPALRFRCEAFFPLLAARGVHVEQASFFTAAEYETVKRARTAATLLPILRGLARQFATLQALRRYDVIWLLREAAPVGPPIIEELIGRVLKKPIVFDFDDAIWIGQDDSFASGLVRWRSKTARVIRMASAVMAGNEFLAAFARLHNPDTFVVPTCVDLDRRFNAVHEHRNAQRPIVGWTGSRSTNGYLETLNAVLKQSRPQLGYDLTVISDRRPALPFDDYSFHPWSVATEIRDLLSFDIGLMPLGDSEWERGKCGFKLIQYMALGIPPIASAVGANLDIVRHGVDGFLCRSNEDWIAALRTLVSDPAMRTELGRSGRRRVEERYSTASQVDRIADLLRGAAGRTAATL